ncbi:pyridoxal phosphate-dependent aminotransferase [Alkalicoccus luteus]|uniref:Pyridoxal phosphate-dependent class II aminotransferase n=1 Tax=Alkalicoccus luteus TaxID=1237094 RepID=A0A969PTC4_9BACI|nr:aminotransferase class I/II-fold pyridoxal phosphate-dependent enzyme [Alkalicoccus luteus]NJP39135.1 pyridoxal phosphate-dependent class II aminotransferase [Alkalicoccus luteus]
MVKWPDHGGQPNYLSVYRSVESQWLDFSANINPLGPPDGMLETAVQALSETDRYPDPSYTACRSKIAAAEQVEPEHVCVTNGGAEAVFLAASLKAGGKAVIAEPAFSEYRRACAHYGIHVHTVDGAVERGISDRLVQAVTETGADMLFLNRPHNPSGVTLAKRDVRQLLKDLPNTAIIVDEAFVDFLPEYEKLNDLLPQHDKLILLRSMTKMFAVPGLRCGFALSGETLAGIMRERQVPWSVNTISETLLKSMMEEEAFVRKTRFWLQDELQWIREQLPQNFTMSDTSVNYYLLQDSLLSDHEPLLAFLAESGIAARHTYSFRGLDGRALRLAVRTRKDNRRLMEVLQKWADMY